MSERLEERVLRLEKSISRSRRMMAGLATLPIFIMVAAFASPLQERAGKPGEIVATKVIVVDDQGVPRVTIGQDKPSTNRRSRAAGITIFDKTGFERGGLGTFDDGSVALALDAPKGVGSKFPDRIGMLVWPHGGTQLALRDNQSETVVQLRSSGDGGGGVDLFQWRLDKVHVKTLTYAGEERSEHGRPQGSGGRKQ